MNSTVFDTVTAHLWGLWGYWTKMQNYAYMIVGYYAISLSLKWLTNGKLIH